MVSTELHGAQTPASLYAFNSILMSTLFYAGCKTMKVTHFTNEIT